VSKLVSKSFENFLNWFLSFKQQH